MSVLCGYFLKAAAVCFCAVMFLQKTFARHLCMAVVLLRQLNGDLMETSL